MFFSIAEQISRKKALGLVSVPLRGYVFLNSMANLFRPCCWRFRPLTGICFSQYYYKNFSNTYNLFPSPYGDMFFSILCLQTTGSKGLQRRSAALTAAGFFLNLCASLVTLFFQPLPLQNTSFSLNSQIFQTSVENGCTSMVQAPISYSSPRYFAHFTVWGETPRRRS